MERLCKACGSLVNGDGQFCPNCGETLESAVDLAKPTASSAQGMPTAEPAPSVTVTSNVPTMSGTTYNTSGNQGTMPNYTNVNVNLTTPINNEEMTLKDWIWTLLLPYLVGMVTCGLGQFVMWIVWACSNSIPIAKKRFAQAQLIFMAISFAIVMLIYVLYFVFVIGVMGLSMADIMSEMPEFNY